MNSFNKRVYEMLNRVVVFATTHPQFFDKGALAGQLLEQVRAAVQALSGHATYQASGIGAVRRSAGSRSKARAALRSQVETISRTARGLKLPEFWMPRNRGDRSILDVGKVFLKNAQPCKQAFIDSHLPADFLERLDVAIQDLENAINDQTVSRAAHMSATAAIEQTRSDALSALQGLDPIMENLLRDDPPTFAVWQSCRHVERTNVAKTVESEASPPGEPPITNTIAAAG